MSPQINEPDGALCCAARLWKAVEGLGRTSGLVGRGPRRSGCPVTSGTERAGHEAGGTRTQGKKELSWRRAC